MPNTKIPIPTINEDEIIYVNYKQHFRILHRREKRRKLNMIKREDFNSRKTKYKHESRHRHAMNRQRNKGGRFVSKNEFEKNQDNKILKENSHDSDKSESARENHKEFFNAPLKNVLDQKFETFTDKESFSCVIENNEDNSHSKNNIQIYLKLENDSQNIKKEIN